MLQESALNSDIAWTKIRRRYVRSWENFQQIYKHLADSWTIFDTSGKLPVIMEESGEDNGKTQ